MYEELLGENPTSDFKANLSATISVSDKADALLSHALLQDASWEILFNQAIALVKAKNYEGALIQLRSAVVKSEES